MKKIVGVFVAILVSLFSACDALSTRPGSFVVVFQWETGHEPDTTAKDYYLWAYYQEWKGGDGKTFPADIESSAKSLNETGPVKLASGATLDFSELTYGDNRFVRAAIWDNEQRTGDPLYIGISELFSFKATDRDKVVAVNMKLQANAGVDETGEGGSFAIEIRHDGAAATRVAESTVTLRFTVKNADTVVIANDLTFEKGLATLKLTDLTQIDEMTYEYGPWDITTGWEGLGDTTYSVFGKSRNLLGYESAPERAEVYLDTTGPVPSITPFPEVAKLGDTIEVRFSFDEEVPPENLELNWSWLEFTLVENKADKSYTFSHTVTVDDPESTADFYLRATDTVGNAMTDHLPIGSVTIDRTSPWVEGALIDTTDDKQALKSGDVLTVSFTASEELSADPLLKIDDRTFTLDTKNESDLTYTYTYTVVDNDISGIKTITASLRDPAGNDATVGLGFATFDLTAPTLLGIAVSPGGAPGRTGPGGKISVVFTASEPLTTITFDSDGLTFENSVSLDGLTHTYTYGVTATDDERTYDFSVNGYDAAGNELATMPLGSVMIDTTPPDVTDHDLSHTHVREGQVFSLSFTVSEPLLSPPVVMIGAQDISAECVADDMTYSCTHTATAAEGNGVKQIALQLVDLAGNATSRNLKDENEQYVTVEYDVTSPDIVNPVVAPVQAGLGSMVDIRFSFTEEVEGVVIDWGALAGLFERANDESDRQLFIFKRQILDTDPQGEFPIAVTAATDLAGNPLPSPKLIGTLIIDRDTPGVVLTQAAPTTVNLSTNTLTIRFEVDEPLLTDPLLRIGVTPVTVLPSIESISGGERYTYAIPILHSEPEGIHKATVDLFDLAGNRYYGELEYAGGGGSPDLVYDFTVPRVITRNASPERANVNTLGIQILASFSEPVQKPASGTVQVQKRVGANWVTQSAMASRVTIEDRPVGYTHALYFNMLDLLNTNDGEYRIHMQTTDEHGNTAVTQSGDLLNLGEFRIDMTLPIVDPVASVTAICTEPTDLNPGETDYCSRVGHIDKAKAKVGDTIYYKLVFDRSDPYYEFDDIVGIWPTVEVSGLGAMAQLSQITYAGDTAPYTFMYRRKVTLADTEDISSYALISMEDAAGNTYRKLSDDLVRTDVTKPTLVASAVAPADSKINTQIVVNFTLSEPAQSVSFNGAGLAFAGGCTTTDNISYRCAHTVATGDTEGTKNFTATATDPTGNTSATLTLGSTVIDKTLPTPTVTSFVISTNSGFQLPNGTHAVAHGHTVSVTTVFTVAETLGVAPIVQIGGTDMTSVACAVPATNKYCFQRLVSNTEGAGLKPLALITEDRAGNITTTTGASWQVVYDFAAPRIVSALFERTPNFAPARDAANQIQYYSIRDPYTNELVTASLTLYADEEIATGPTLTGFNLGTAAVSTDTVYFSRTLADTDAAGTYPLTISWSDRLGNSTTLGIPWQMAIDKTAPLTTRVSMDKFLYTRIPYGSNATAGTPRYNASAVEGAVTYLSGDSFKGDIKKVFLYNDNNQYVAQGDVIYDVAGLVSQPIDIQNMPAGNTLFIKAGFLDRAGNISSLSTVRFIEWIATMGDKVAGSSFENPLSYYKMNNFSFRTYVDPDYQIEDIFAAARIDQFDDSVSNTVVQPEWYEYLGNGTYTPPTTDRRSMVFDPARGTFLSIGTTYTDAGTVYEFDPATNTWRTINVDGVKPSPYDGAPIAYDTTRNKLFLFGGGTGTGAGTGDELWEFDTEQRRWTWLDDPDPRLGSPREFASMIYDPKRHRLILFGGSDGWGSGDSNETWIYYIDGYGWENATDEYEPANNPSARSATAMAYDPENDTVILFGGCYYDMDIDCNNDTWELNPNTLRWTRLYPTAPAMGIRGWHGMSYDPVREKILLYGGYDDDSGTYYSSLYQYDRRLNTWVSVTTNGATPITSGAFGIAYDTIRDRTLIWGGVDISGNSTNKVYEFDGPNSRWTELTTRVPTANAWSSDRMIFNANRGRYLLYMGNTSGNDSVWEFDPNERRWTQMTVNSGPTNKYISSYGMVHEPTGSYRTMVWGGSSSKKMYYWTPGAGDTGTWTDVAQIGTLPTAYYEVAMAYDSGHNWALLFGGRVGGTYYNGTFIYRVSDAQWFDMTSSDPSPPTARIAAAMVYDPDNTRMLLFGGRASGGSALNELWQFNLGTYQWTTVTPIGSPPPARYNHSMVYDASRKKIILYGGRTSSSDSSVLEDLWEYDIAGNRWYQIYFATGRGPGTLDDYAMAIDPSAGRVLIYDNLTNHTYALYTVVMETPAHLLKVPLRYAYGSYYVSLYDLRVDVYAGASVNSGTGGEIKHGAMLDAWYGGRWLNVASNTADFETYGSLSFSVTDQNLLSRMPVGETDTLQFAIRAKGPQGTGSTGELAVDYAEVRVKYDLYASPPAPVSEYFVGTTTQTWENARLDCRSRGMDLVTVDSWSEYNSIKGLVGTTNSYWLGYHDIYRDGEWRWVGGDVGWRGDASGYWVGNAYNQWLTGYPTSSGTDNCASFHKTNNSGNWLSSPCTSTFLYVCERHPGEKRYYASTSTANWTNANTICTNAGGKLVSINSGLEQKTIEQRISRYQNYWIGLRDTGSNYWYWSDGTLASRGLGTATIPYGYTNWITYPAARPVTSNYYGLIAGPVSSLYTDYKWADASGASAYYYVCEF